MAQVPYASAVGYLTYAMVCTRPDLAQAVSQVSKYMSNPRKQHWEAVKWILRYLRGTTNYSLMFGGEDCKDKAIGFVDSDYGGDLDNRKFTTGYVFTLAGGPIYWRYILQSIVAMSTTEVEYIAMGEAAKEALWNQVYHARTKHIQIRFHKNREFVTSGEIILEKVHTSENAADMLTKPVTTEKFRHCLDLLHVCKC
ncbi:Retrovirus-related Pol polyprotein from transposon TNT 1-94 [Cardamine amara subsp. amara]|uniref:Retrovirus-related Pol polyprotein from transposon TNT 1-94 n=1 Tax=Cardamine amara subsp. amara TaxID=228776 RepID=A0ABD0ZV30_CARAN